MSAMIGADKYLPNTDVYTQYIVVSPIFSHLMTTIYNILQAGHSMFFVTERFTKTICLVFIICLIYYRLTNKPTIIPPDSPPKKKKEFQIKPLFVCVCLKLVWEGGGGSLMRIKNKKAFQYFS